MKRVNVVLSDEDLERAARTGGGNVSHGIRLALRQRSVTTRIAIARKAATIKKETGPRNLITKGEKKMKNKELADGVQAILKNFRQLLRNREFAELEKAEKLLAKGVQDYVDTMAMKIGGAAKSRRAGKKGERTITERARDERYSEIAHQAVASRAKNKQGPSNNPKMS
jgi:hypothetical protein